MAAWKGALLVARSVRQMFESSAFRSVDAMAAKMAARKALRTAACLPV